MNVTKDGVNITYPDLGFAFNPLCVILENYTDARSVTLHVGDTTIKRGNLKGSGDNTIIFDLSAIARSLFDHNQFHQVEEKDTTLYKTLKFSLQGGSIFKYEGSIPVIWGALQIAEVYAQSKTLTYFRGFPFTIPIYIDNRVTLKLNGVEYKMLDPGKHNLDITGLNIQYPQIKLELFSEEHYKIFDYTFDFTFGPQRVLLDKDVSIKVNVVDCPKSGVYLRWINKHGEYNYYLFQSSNISSTTKNNSIYFDNIYYTTNLHNNYHYGTGKSIGKNIEYSRKLFAPLVDSVTFDLLIGLVESPIVDLFLGYDEKHLPKWISVSVAEGTFTKSTANLQDFELSLIPNKKQIQIL